MAVSKVFQFIFNHPLNQHQKAAALLRFLTWQVRSRLTRGSVVHPWIDGAKFLVRRGETGLTGNVYAGLHEFTDMGYLLHLLRADDCFIDVGANVGAYTLLACAARRAKGYAFEPVPSTYARLRENLRINDLDGLVDARNIGLGAQPDTIYFTADHDTVNHALADGETTAHSIAAPVLPLDDVLQLTQPTLMKIDVEGFETPVLQGAKQTLANPLLHSIIIELNGAGAHYGFDEQKIVVMLQDLGFNSYSYDPLQRRLIGLQGKNLGSGNTLFIRDEAFVRQRIASASHIELYGLKF